MTKKTGFLGVLFVFLMILTISLDLYVFDNHTYPGSFWLLVGIEMGAIGVLCLIANTLFPGPLTKLFSMCFFLMCAMGIMIEVENGFIIPKEHFIGYLLLILIWGIGVISIIYLLFPPIRIKAEVVGVEPIQELGTT